MSLHAFIPQFDDLLESDPEQAFEVADEAVRSIRRGQREASLFELIEVSEQALLAACKVAVKNGNDMDESDEDEWAEVFRDVVEYMNGQGEILQSWWKRFLAHWRGLGEPQRHLLAHQWCPDAALREALLWGGETPPVDSFVPRALVVTTLSKRGVEKHDPDWIMADANPNVLGLWCLTRERNSWGNRRGDYRPVGLIDGERAARWGDALEFERLLAQSVSLDWEEKATVIDKIVEGELDAAKVYALKNVFEQEESKFLLVGRRQQEQLGKICEKYWTEWDRNLKRLAYRVRGRVANAADIPTPAEIAAHLDERLIGNQDVKHGLAVALHYQRHVAQALNQGQEPSIRPMGPILVWDPTGSGKTAVVRCATEFLGLPFAYANASSLVAEGIRGMQLGELGEMLLRRAGDVSSAAKGGVVFLDEFDKLLDAHWGRSILDQILTAVEGGELRWEKRAENGAREEARTLPAENILWVFAGVFDGIAPERRARSIGFSADRGGETLGGEDVHHALAGSVGAEVMGRIRQVIRTEPVTKETLLGVLRTPYGADSPFNEVRKYLLVHGLEIELSDDAEEELAERALRLGGGVRGVQSLLDRVCQHLLFEAPEHWNDGVVNCLNRETIVARLR